MLQKIKTKNTKLIVVRERFIIQILSLSDTSFSRTFEYKTQKREEKKCYLILP